MSAILQLKHFFRPKTKPLSYKYNHFLNNMAREKLDQVLLYSEGDNLAQTAFELKGKQVLFCNDSQHKYALKKMVQAEPKTLVNLVYDKTEWQKQRTGYCTIQGELNHLPIRKGYFDYYVCPFALKTDMRRIEKHVQTFSQHMNNGQKLFLSVQHPALNQILYNQNPATTTVNDATLAKIFDILKKNSLFTENIYEGVVDLSLKPYFINDEFDYYHEYKNTPLTVVFTTVKFKRS